MTKPTHDPLSAPISPAVAEAMAASGLEPGRSPVSVRLPDPAELFQRRADQLLRFAPGHTLSSWLEFVAQLSLAQHALATGALPAGSPTSPEARWKLDLEALRERLRGALPAMVEEALDGLPWGDAEALDALAVRLTGGEARTEDLGGAPFVVAALQVAWTRYAAGLTAAGVAVSAVAGNCPVCGGAPVAGIIHTGHTGAGAGGLRYLHCGLCHTAWHHVRSACVACGEGNRIGLRSIEGQDGPARAETCDACNSYLKLLLEEKAPGLDPVAEDLASFALDVLVGDDGFQRIGGNPFLVQAE